MNLLTFFVLFLVVGIAFGIGEAVAKDGYDYLKKLISSRKK